MSRVSVLESLYSKKKSALEFNYDNLWAPPIKSLLSQEDINDLIGIATSLKYNGKIEKKYKLIDQVMNRRGFRKAHSGTNRVVYNFLEDTRFVAKIAVDRVGMKDTPMEYKNQKYFAPFCCKIFEVDPSGVIGFVERVNPITSLEEFLSVSDDIFNMIITKIVGKYVVDDIGTTKFMNFGLRMNGFGPVIIDFPYAYELDGRKLRCNRMIKTPYGQVPCGGEIDYDDGFNYLVCTKCGKSYQARDLANDSKDILVLNSEGGLNIMQKARIIDSATGKVIIDDCTSTKTYISKEQFNAYNSTQGEFSPKQVVSKTKTTKRKSREEMKNNYYTQLMLDKFNQTSPLTTPLSEALGMTSRVAVSQTNTNGKIKKNNIPKEEKHEEEVKVVNNDAVEETINNNTVEEDITQEETHKIDIVEEAINTIAENILPECSEENDAQEDNNEEESSNNLNLENFSIGKDVEEEEPDYSNYEVEEEPEEQEEDSEEDELNYSDYIKNIKKDKQKQHKFDKDMEDY